MTALPDKLWHYTGEPLAMEPRAYEQPEPREYGKPVGLWVSVEGKDDWPSWCQGEEFRLDQLAYRTPMTIKDGASVLFINPGTLRRFDTDFGVSWRWGENSQWTARGIDWRAVAERYDGIIIAPYSWHHRLEMSWYYTWDCASGCIWNLDAVTVGESEPHALPECMTAHDMRGAG